MLLEYFNRETHDTITGQFVGIEVETDFVDSVTSRPISADVSRSIQSETAFGAVGFAVQGELGRQKIELAIEPHDSPEALIDTTMTALQSLYESAARYGARPRFDPEMKTSASLLAPYDHRDRLWLRMDGQEALEDLCRCSSVQFTVDVNPNDAIDVINALWSAQVHKYDYEPNNRRWMSYITNSKAGYREDRYGGPRGFSSLKDYAQKLEEHRVVMHDGVPVSLDPKTTENLNIDLYLRSVWWHYRLRRFGNKLCVEIRPFARRRDEDIVSCWNQIAALVGRNIIGGQDAGKEAKSVSVGL
jgi:hypothetical protein